LVWWAVRGSNPAP